MGDEKLSTKGGEEGVPWNGSYVSEKYSFLNFM